MFSKCITEDIHACGAEGVNPTTAQLHAWPGFCSVFVSCIMTVIHK